MIVYQNFDLPHSYIVSTKRKPICDMITTKLFIWFTNLLQSHGISIFTKYHKFHKNLKLYQSFFKHICIFQYIVTYFLLHKYILTSHHVKLKKVVFLAFDFFVFFPIIICTNIVKILINNDMVEVQIWVLFK
jgi:hypothetical protein